MRHMTAIRPNGDIAANEGLGGLKLRTPLTELEHLLWAFDVKRGSEEGVEYGVIVAFWPCFRDLSDRRTDRHLLFQQAEAFHVLR
jgi:hypothetical protein